MPLLKDEWAFPIDCELSSVARQAMTILRRIEERPYLVEERVQRKMAR